MDITSLNTVIPYDEGLRAFEHFSDQHIVKGPIALKHYSA